VPGAATVRFVIPFAWPDKLNLGHRDSAIRQNLVGRLGMSSYSRYIRWITDRRASPAPHARSDGRDPAHTFTSVAVMTDSISRVIKATTTTPPTGQQLTIMDTPAAAHVPDGRPRGYLGGMPSDQTAPTVDRQALDY